MASYRFSAQVMKRSAGRSATAAAAYRAGEEITCERYGETHDYTRKGGIEYTEVIAPEHAPEWMRDRAALWNAVEAAEKRKDAQLAREVQMSLPHEMDAEQRRELVRAFVAQEFVSRGMVADIALHAPNKQGDERNFHAHVMLTMREIMEDGFGKKVRAWNDTQLLEHWRESWADLQNRALERAGQEARVDHRSFEDRGIDREPQQHEGHAATSMKRKGQETRIGAENERRERENEQRQKRHVEALRELATIAAARQKFEDWAAEKTGSLEAAQGLSMLDLTREHEHAADELRNELHAFYEPHLATVRHEAARLESSLAHSGLVARFRRVFTGKAERDRLDKLQATIRDAENRKKEALDAQHKRQAVEQARLAGLQEERRASQHDGIERARERKEADLSEREARAKDAMQRATEAQQAAQRPRSLAERIQEAKERPDDQPQERGKDRGMDFER